ncbi:MAG TPA: Ig-like domain-containing protein [Bacteroidales bacterium]|nr:Ig-like domain-containing protein [Bacteroidales bacterium]
MIKLTAIANYPESTSKLQFEKILQDDADGFVTDTPIDLSERLIRFSFNPKPINKKIFADGKLQADLYRCLEGEIEIELTGLTAAEKSAIFGFKNVGAIRREGDISLTPFHVVKRQIEFSGGKIVGERYLKVKFTLGDENSETATTEKISADSVILKGTTCTTVHVFSEENASNPLKDVCDNMDPLYNGELATWFIQGVSYSAVDTVAPTLSSVTPASGATNQLATVNVVWDFDKTILPSTVTADNFFLIKDSDGSKVAGALSVDDDKVTFNPTASLTAEAVYTAVYTTGVKSITGIAIAAPSYTKFTIAAS